MIGQQMITEARATKSATERVAVMHVGYPHRAESFHVHSFLLNILRPLSDFFDRIRLHP